MIAGIYNVEMEQGSTFERVLRVMGPSDVPYNFTGYTFRMKIRNKSNVVVWDSSAADPGGELTLQGDNNNEILWKIDADTTAGFKFDEGKYDLELVSGTNVYKLLRGKIQLIKESTR